LIAKGKEKQQTSSSAKF